MFQAMMFIVSYCVVCVGIRYLWEKADQKDGGFLLAFDKLSDSVFINAMHLVNRLLG